ncbi:MAG TPA: hypothetical protein VMD30_06765 [Tepidisphaeraceae bacterium]|nr:hypothetical protein [Tepidisphaeraceae bacterium]
MSHLQRFTFAASLVAAALSLAVFAASASAQSTIAQVTNGGAGNYNLDNVQVEAILDSYKGNDTIVLQDSTGSIIDYSLPNTTYTPTVGDYISITATNAPYQDGAELTGSTTALTALPVHGTASTPLVLTIPEFNAATAGANGTTNFGTPPNVESIVTLDNVTFTDATSPLGNKKDYTIEDSSDNQATLYTYGTYSNVAIGDAQINSILAAGGVNQPMDITGYVDNYFGSSELYPLSAVAVPEPGCIALAAFGGLALIRRRRRA